MMDVEKIAYLRRLFNIFLCDIAELNCDEDLNFLDEELSTLHDILCDIIDKLPEK